ncbi:MAG TPA: restriction endonuclease subunit S [Actinomycetes bacterium]|jgi:type I restriction enzyme S subunit|nr:restriction endonuclease subunit S [Actinomycetes bacterium]
MQSRFYSWFGNSIGASYFIDQGKQTVNLASLSMTRLKELPVPVPSPEEQSEIVRRVDKLLRVADDLLAGVEKTTRQVGRSSQAVLAKAFRGELSEGEQTVNAERAAEGTHP